MFLIFVAVSIVHLFCKYLDIRSSRDFADYGMVETNPIFRGRNGEMVEWRAWVAVGVWTAIASVLFFVPEQTESWHPLYSLGVYALSGLASIWMYFHNERKKKNARARRTPLYR